MHAIASREVYTTTEGTEFYHAPACLTIVIVRTSNILNVYTTSVLPIIVIYFKSFIEHCMAEVLGWFGSDLHSFTR